MICLLPVLYSLTVSVHPTDIHPGWRLADVHHRVPIDPAKRCEKPGDPKRKGNGFVSTDRIGAQTLLRNGTALSTLALLGAGLITFAVATPAMAQSTTAASEEEPAGEIVVTGSRIASDANLTSTSPVTVVSGAETKYQGANRIEDVMNSLPQVFASQNSTDANGASGIATVDLRGLGTSRTLVLVNGRRLTPGDVSGPAADLNFIPTSLVQRVDVLTGGASSVYGSDALSGVVNFILNTQFDGIQLDGQYSFYNHNNDLDGTLLNALQTGQNGATRSYANRYPRGNTVDGAQKSLTLTVGTGTDDGRGHVTAYASWRQINAVTQGDRDYSYCGASDGAYQRNAVTGVGIDGQAYCGGSSTTDVGRFRRTQNTALGDIPVYGGTGPSYTLDPNNPGQFRTYNAARDQFNFNPYNFFQRPDERFSFGTFAHYEVSKSFDAYVEAMFMDDRTDAQIAPSGAFYATDFFVNCNNALMSGSQRTALCGTNANTNTLQSLYIGRRNVEGGGRNDDLRHTAYRIVAGGRGEIAPGITYDAYGQFGRTVYAETYTNDFSRTRLNRALNVVLNSAGQPVCASTLRNASGIIEDGACVPYNIFTPGGVSQAAIDYLQIPTVQSGQTTEYVASGALTADLGNYGVKSPFAESGFGFAAGLEYRKEALLLTNDVANLTGDRAGAGTPFGVRDAKGSFDVFEQFVELQAPLVAEKPFFYDLSANVSYRHAKYSIQGSTDTYKFGGTYAPVRGLALRGTYSRAVRAPNILELFTPANVVLFNGQDLCAGAVGTDGTVNGFTLAQCARSGVSAAQFGTIDPSPAGQYNQQTAGFAGLEPEIADTYTVGVVINPSFARSFSLSVDAFDIKINKLIGTLGANYSLRQCITANQFCDRINRSADGSLFTGPSFVRNPSENLGSLRTRGIDVVGNYRLNLADIGLNDAGNIALNLVGTYLNAYKVQTLAGGDDYNCAGLYGSSCGIPNPKWRHKFRATWDFPSNVQVSGAWRYFGGVTNDYMSDNSQLSNPDFEDPLTRKIKAVSYFDLSISALIADKFTWRIGAQNLLDRTPPITYAYNSNGSNTYAGTYDPLGRYIYTGITLNFK